MNNPMKKNLIRLAGLGALAGGLIFAQNVPANPDNAAAAQPARHARRFHRMQRMANYLNLTADQKAQAKQIWAGAREEAKPLRQQMKANRQALLSAIKSGNDAQIDQITKSEAPVMAQLASIRAHAFEKFYATLTPDQKTKVDSMHQQFRGGRKG